MVLSEPFKQERSCPLTGTIHREMKTMSMRPSFFALVVCIGVAITWAGSAQAETPTKPFPPSQVNPRLQTVLQELAQKAQAHPMAVQAFAKGKNIPVSDNLVTVIVEQVSGHVSAISQAAVVALGGQIEASSESLMRVRVPVAKLEALADQVAGVAYIRLPYRPRALTVTSQGVALTGASAFHTAGYEGQGVKIAVIDMGFNGLTASENAGELPNVVYTHDYTSDGDVEIGINHGTAVAEIVSDMAPQASLYLLKISDEVDLQNATSYCIANGIRIISHSLGWYDTNYYDGTGAVADAANNARDNGILWVNAAGNEAENGHWQGAFVDSDSDGYLNFGPGVNEDTIYATEGDTVRIYMTWDDWPTSDQDYDLYLCDSSGTAVASSDDYQGGSQAPVEEITYDVPATGNYQIKIYDFSAPELPNIEFFAFTGSGASLDLQYGMPQSSIVAPANSAKVVAVGAIYQGNWATGPQETYSSQGPSNTSKYAASIVKPDICGPDGVSNYTWGSFYGTSAATPHIAGAAALLLCQDPTMTVDELQAELEATAIDMGVAGKDNVYGSGRLNLVLSAGTSAVFRVEKIGNVYADGSYYGSGFYSGAADVAEWVPVSEPVEPGDLLELDPANPGQYRKARGPCSTLIAGVVSTDPGLVLGSEDLSSGKRLSTRDSGLSTDDSGLSADGSAPLALVGIVPVKVTDEGGPIYPGDLLVSSSTPGYAKRWNGPGPCPSGSLVGKALGTLTEGTGIISVLLAH